MGATFVPKLLRGLLPRDSFQYLEQLIRVLHRQVEGQPYNEPALMRHVVYDPPWLASLHEELGGQVAAHLGRPVKRTYSYVSLYGPEGICPPHTDRRHCEYTVSLCVSQKHPWALNVAGEDYLLEVNDGLLFNGTRQVHYRPRIDPDNYCHVVLFHFVDLDFQESVDKAGPPAV